MGTANTTKQLDLDTASLDELRAEYRRLLMASGMTAAEFRAAAQSNLMEWFDGEETVFTPKHWCKGAAMALAEREWERRNYRAIARR